MKFVKASVLDEISEQAINIRNDVEHALGHIGMIKDVTSKDGDMEPKLMLDYILSALPVLETYFECIKSSAKCINLTVKLPSSSKPAKSDK